MKRMTVPAFLVAAVLAFSLAGCSQAQSMSEDTLKGVWALESGDALGFDAYISFEDDSVVEMTVADSWLQGTWSVSGTEGKAEFEESSYMPEAGDEEAEPVTRSVKLTYGNNKLTLGSSDGSKLVFVKDDSEEARELFAFDSMGDEGLDGEQVEYVDEVIDPVDPAVVIADDDKFSISVTGKGTDYTGDPCFVLSIANKTDKAVYVTPQDEFTVGGQKVEAGLGDEIEAGDTIETEMYFAQDDLGGALEKLTTVDGVIEVLDDETDDAVATYPFHME